MKRYYIYFILQNNFPSFYEQLSTLSGNVSTFSGKGKPSTDMLVTDIRKIRGHLVKVKVVKLNFGNAVFDFDHFDHDHFDCARKIYVKLLRIYS